MGSVIIQRAPFAPSALYFCFCCMSYVLTCMQKKIKEVKKRKKIFVLAKNDMKRQNSRAAPPTEGRSVTLSILLKGRRSDAALTALSVVC